MGAAVAYGTLFHEVLHILEDRDPEFDVLCLDLSNNSVAFATHTDYFEKTYEVDSHLGIYFLEGCVFMIIVFGGSFFVFNLLFRKNK